MFSGISIFRLLLIGLGGAIGTISRYLFSGLVQRIAGPQYPAGTLAVNLVGCLAIGWLGGLAAAGSGLREETRLMLLVGVLGGFTTFSTFGLETVQFINDAQWARAGMNILLHNVLGVLLVLAGFRLAQ